MTTAAAKNRPFPLTSLVIMGGLVGTSLLLAAGARLTGMQIAYPTTKPVAVRDLRFQDESNGSITVFNAANGREIEVVAPGTNGFLRASLRGLASERKLENRDAQVPFRLTAWDDDRLTLDDPTTGRRVDLEAFGPTNEAVFIRLLPGAGIAP